MAKITKISNPKADWNRVLNFARFTAGKNDLYKEPSNGFKRQILLAEHSPIRMLEYDITIEDIQQWITTHLVRHWLGFVPAVNSQRTDRNDEAKRLSAEIFEALKPFDLGLDSERDALPQGTRNKMRIAVNAQSFINVSRKRLCFGCPSKETRKVWEAVVMYLSELDPILSEKCVPECVYRGFCPEQSRCCGYCDTEAYQNRLNQYRRTDNE